MSVPESEMGGRVDFRHHCVISIDQVCTTGVKVLGLGLGVGVWDVEVCVCLFVCVCLWEC